MGNGELIDSLIHDGLWCAFDAVHMGSGTERYTGELGGITREAQDELAAKSHERAAAAMKEGRFADEIAPVAIPQRKGDPVIVEEDEGVRPGHHHRVTRRPAARVREGRHDHRRQRVADLRRRRRGRSSRVAEGRRARPHADRRARELRHGRRPRPVAAPAAVARDQAARSSRSTGRSATSTCSSSTRRSRPSGSRRCATSASPTTS